MMSTISRSFALAWTIGSAAICGARVRSARDIDPISNRWNEKPRQRPGLFLWCGAIHLRHGRALLILSCASSSRASTSFSSLRRGCPQQVRAWREEDLAALGFGM